MIDAPSAYVATVAPELGTEVVAGVQFGSDTPGTFDLGAETQTVSCEHCVGVSVDGWDGGDEYRSFFQQSGSLTLEAEGNRVLDGYATFSLSDVTLIEVGADGDETVPVPGGACLYLASAELDQPSPIPDEWTCPTTWFSDSDCDCGCGALDSACTSTTDIAECDFCGGCGANDPSACENIVYPDATTVCLPRFALDSGPIDVAIPDSDLNGVCIPVISSAAGTVDQVEYVRVAMDHTYVADLRLVVVAPDTDFYNVMLSHPGSSANLSASSPIYFQTSSAVGANAMGAGLLTDDVVCQTDGVCSFFPEPEGFGFLADTPATGTWYLCAYDESAEDTGRVTSFSMGGTVY